MPNVSAVGVAVCIPHRTAITGRAESWCWFAFVLFWSDAVSSCCSVQCWSKSRAPSCRAGASAKSGHCAAQPVAEEGVGSGVAGGGCIRIDQVLNPNAIFTDLHTEILALASATLPEDLPRLREKMIGAFWRLDDFDTEVIKRQVTAFSKTALSSCPGWPAVATRQAIKDTQQVCYELTLTGEVAWKGSHMNSSRSYFPDGDTSSYLNNGAPRAKHELEGINNFEDIYTESVLRTGFNAAPCDRRHLMEMLLTFRSLMLRLTSEYGVNLSWQVGSSTLISGLRTGHLLPWEFDADVYVTQPEKPDRGAWHILQSVWDFLSDSVWPTPRAPETDQENAVKDPSTWLYQKLKESGYQVSVRGSHYWIVRYSKDNGMYMDIIWPTNQQFDEYYGGRLRKKTMRLYEVEFPYFVDLTLEYSESWVVPNRGPECMGRCQTMQELLARQQCACICAREPSRDVDARWHLANWRLEHNATPAASLARAVVEEAARRGAPAGSTGAVCVEFPNVPDVFFDLEGEFSDEVPNFLRFILHLRNARRLHGDQGATESVDMSTGVVSSLSCEDLRQFCYGWFGDLVRRSCASTCAFGYIEERDLGDILSKALSIVFR